jgi:hypothetical protein
VIAGKRITIALALALTSVAVALPGTSGANVTIGSADPLSPSVEGVVGCGTPPCSWSQAALPGRLLSAPVNGRVVRWSVQWANTPDTVALQVLRTSAGGAIFLAATAPEPISTPTHSFAASLPISIGDRIAVQDLGATVSSPRGRTVPGAVIDTWVNSPPPNVPTPPDVSNNPPDTELLLNAEIEPSNDATLSRPRLNKKKGNARLTVTLPNAGSLTIGGRPVRPQTLTATQPGPIELVLAPTKKAKKGLKRKGKAKGKTRFTFTPEFGTAATKTLPLTLKRKPPRR